MAIDHNKIPVLFLRLGARGGSVKVEQLAGDDLQLQMELERKQDLDRTWIAQT